MAFIVRDTRRQAQQMSQQRFVSTRGFVQRFHVIARYYKDVRRRLRVDVANGNAALILMNQGGRDFASDNFAEEAIVFGHDCVC